MTAPAKGLLPLLAQLKSCPAREHGFTRKELVEMWNCIKEITPEHGDEITPAMMAGLVLFDEEQFAQLLNEAERSQLTALAKLALERFTEKSNPPNKLGKAIAAALKESI